MLPGCTRVISVALLLWSLLATVRSASRQTLSTVYEYVSEFSDAFPVKIALHPLAIHTLDIVAMEFRFEVMCETSWTLPTSVQAALSEMVENNGVSPQSEYVYLSPDLVNGEELWRPDLYFVQAKRVSTPSNLEASKVFMGFKNLTQINLQERLSLIVSCQLDLKRYPFDSHRCQLQVRSFLLPASLLKFEPLHSVLHISPRIRRQMIGYDFEIYLNETEITYGEELGEPFKTFIMDFRISRRPLHQILTSIVPSTLMVTVGFSVFLMDASATAERISLSVVTLLTQYTQLALVRKTLPPCSYVTNIDAYMFACLTIILLIVIECVLLDYIRKQEKAQLLPTTTIEKLKQTMSGELLAHENSAHWDVREDKHGNPPPSFRFKMSPSFVSPKKNSPEYWQSENEIRQRLFIYHSTKVNPAQARNDIEDQLVRAQEKEKRQLRSAHLRSLEEEFLVGPRAEKFDRYCRHIILVLFALFSVMFWLDSMAEIFCTDYPDEFGHSWKHCRAHFF